MNELGRLNCWQWAKPTKLYSNLWQLYSVSREDPGVYAAVGLLIKCRKDKKVKATQSEWHPASRWCTAIPGLVTKGLRMIHRHTRFGYKRPQNDVPPYQVWLQKASRWCTAVPGLVTKGLKMMYHHTRFGYKRPQNDVPPYQVWLQKASRWCTTIPGLVTKDLRMMHHHTRFGYKRPQDDAPPYQVWLQKASRWCTTIPGLVTKGRAL